MTTQRLILKSFTGSRWTLLPKVPSGTVMVVTYGNEDLETFTRRPRFRERRGALRIDLVDIRPHHSSYLLHLPAMGDVYHFSVRVDAQWKAEDPVAVVQARMGDPGLVVMDAVDHLFRQRTRRYVAKDAEGAERELNEAVSAPTPLGNGLELTACRTRVQTDGRLVERTLRHDTNEFNVEQDRHLLLRDKRRIEHLREFVNGNSDALVIHLAQHPEDTAHILEQIVEAQERDRAARMDLLQHLVERGFVLDADVAPLRERVLGLSTDSTWAGRWVSGLDGPPNGVLDPNGHGRLGSVTALLPTQAAPPAQTSPPTQPGASAQTALPGQVEPEAESSEERE